MTYRLAAAPRHAALRSWDCVFCSHEDLARPVFLEGPAGLVSAGSGCAVLALHPGYEGSTASAVRVLRRDAAHLDHLAAVEGDLRAERRVRYAAALVEFEAGHQAWSDVLLSTQPVYRQAGAGTLCPFPVFLLAVALTGLLPNAVAA